MDYVTDCLELGDRAAFALIIRDRGFASRLARMVVMHPGLWPAIAAGRAEAPRTTTAGPRKDERCRP